MTDLSDVRALVTGATDGLGRAMAQALADAGARVVVTGRDRERTAAAAAAIGPGATGVAFDVRDPAAVRDGVTRAVDALGAIDLLVNNAGIGMRTVNPRFMTDPQPFWELTPDGFRDVLETKATGTFLVARAVVPMMLAAGGGRVVTISMNEQTMVRRGFAPYGPSGAAVEALARVMAADLAQTPVRAQPPAPGWGHRHRHDPRGPVRTGAGAAARSRDHGAADRLASLGRGGRRPRRADRRDRVPDMTELRTLIDSRRRAAGLSWTELVQRIGGPPARTLAALYGQHPLSAEEASRTAEILDLDADCRQQLTEIPPAAHRAQLRDPGRPDPLPVLRGARGLRGGDPHSHPRGVR